MSSTQRSTRFWLALLAIAAMALAACGGGSSPSKAIEAGSGGAGNGAPVDVVTSTTSAAAGGGTTTTVVPTAASPVTVRTGGSPTTVTTTASARGIATKVTALTSKGGAAPATTASGGSAATTATTATTAEPKPVTIRLAYFPNLTHATAIVGIDGGIFRDALGRNKLEVSTFNAGPSAVEALFSGALDATYIGPNPTINAYVQSKGQAIRIISGATSGGAALVVRANITRAADLKGKKVATPQLGNTQDVALRYWLKQNGLSSDKNGGGDVSVLPQDNGQTLDAFKSGVIDGAWVPEPWVTRLVQEGGAKILVNEKDLWRDGQFVTTHLIVRTAFLDEHPDVVLQLLEGQIRASDFINAHPAQSQAMVDANITKVTGKGIDSQVIQAAWANLTFTNDPIPSSLRDSAAHAQDVGLLEKTDLSGIYDLRNLNQLLRAIGQKEVQGF